MNIFGNKFKKKLIFSSEGLLFFICSPAELKEVKDCTSRVADRTVKKEKTTAILIATLYKKNYFVYGYLLSGELVPISQFRFLRFMASF